jgi:hypothetical protein
MRHLHIKAPPLPRRSLYAPAPVANTPIAVANKVANKPEPVANETYYGGPRGKGMTDATVNEIYPRYRDKEKRRAYMREYMRKRRAGAPST